MFFLTHKYFMDIQQLTYDLMWGGAVLALAPVTATSIIACSKIIAVNMIADIGIRLLTGNRYYLLWYSGRSPGIIEVPFLWTVSYYACIGGSSLVAISFIVKQAHAYLCPSEDLCSSLWSPP